MPCGTSSSRQHLLHALAVGGVGDLARDAAATTGVRHQHAVAAGQRQVGGERGALVAALFLDDLDQQDLPALDDFLDLVLADRVAAAALARLALLDGIVAAQRFDRDFGLRRFRRIAGRLAAAVGIAVGGVDGDRRLGAVGGVERAGPSSDVRWRSRRGLAPLARAREQGPRRRARWRRLRPAPASAQRLRMPGVRSALQARPRGRVGIGRRSMPPRRRPFSSGAAASSAPLGGAVPARRAARGVLDVGAVDAAPAARLVIRRRPRR